MTGRRGSGFGVAHSLIQCTVNVVIARFAAFTVSTIVLAVLAVRVALAII